jgi:hypothetical protein
MQWALTYLLVLSTSGLIVFLATVAYSLILKRRAVAAQVLGMSSIDYSVSMARESFEMQRQSFEFHKRSIQLAEESLLLHRRANELLEELVHNVAGAP